MRRMLCAIGMIAAGVAALNLGLLSARAEEPSKPTPQFTPPPKDAVVLFDGKDAKEWTRLNGSPCPWKVEQGALACVPRSGNIRTKKTFGDQKLHIEFRTPLMADAKGQGRGNSGVYIQGRYEIQVLDSYGIDPIQIDDCGSLYKEIKPSRNACLPPEEWQSYDITFIGPKLDENNKVVKKARLTVVQNGLTIINDQEIPRTTPGGFGYHQLGQPGPLMLQDHGNKVAFRNIWVQPIK